MSPVVATLILILVAVAAAAALYLWLVAWQGGVTAGIGSPGAQATLTIGGSTSVFPFDSLAVTQFQQNNTDVVISNNQGGTGAGMLAVCSGAVDIGASSSLQTVSGLETSDHCPVTVTITTVAYDAVDVLTAAANTHGLNSIGADTLLAVYDHASTSTPTLVATTVDGVTTGAAPLNGLPAGALAWNQIPACAAAVANCGGTGNPTEGIATSLGIGIACPVGVDTCASGAGASPCGFSVCAGPFAGVTGGDAIKTVARSDASGTTQAFEARLLGATSASALATSTAGLGFSGCGSNNLLADCGIATTLTGNGNPGVITAVAGSPDAIGYASDGLARVSTSGVTCQGVPTAACGIGFAGIGQAAPVQPSLGATGTVAAGITSSTTVANYVGWRPFEFVTANTPTGEAQDFITYVLDPANNQNFATESGEVSVYSI